ncbi:hypothetical protein COCCU_01980 [Corynebacterium occultum]|uniref:Uncharacterized protein n=1 Tax=Corynebacterium occultum TaxID=2675219 RepID=A0A6B8W4S2_9CORY|nr:hypothetical protein [Corynebacterium occultum]QGU06355.1 hypothetical protein COCCU_01980 [Corynebacterium occultum]
MPSMFPGFRNDPNDLNRRYRPTERDRSGVPLPIAWGYYLLVGIAILMVVTSLFLFSARPPDPGALGSEAATAVRNNLAFVGVLNLVAGILISALAPQLKKGSRDSRRWLLGVIIIATLLNLISFVILREPFSLALVAALLMISGVVIFQPSATAYINRIND